MNDAPPTLPIARIRWTGSVLLALLALWPSASPALGEAAPADVEATMIPSPQPAQQHWPRWRGPSGQGIVEDVGYVDRWSPTENVLWKVAVPGSGNSSPIVWGDVTVLTTAYDGGARRSIVAFSRRDGSKLWETFAPEASPENAYEKNGHATATPTTDGERVYAYFGNHGLMAVDLDDGELAWHVPLGPFEAYHGTACSPLLYGDRVILVQDHRGASGSFIAAFDKTSGSELWRTPRDAQVGWNSPIAVRAGDRDEIVMSGMKSVKAYDPQTGKQLWQADGTTFEVIPTPVVGHDLIFASSGRAGPTLAIRPGGSGNVTETHVVWSSPKGSPFVVAPVLAGEYLYMVNDMASILTVYHATSGEVAWQQRLGRVQREGFSAAGIAMGGKVFFTNDDGQTFVIRQGPDFELLHVNDLDERTIASPALVDGVWYVRTAQHLWALGRADA